MSFQPVNRKSNPKKIVFALLIIALVAINFGSVKSFAQSAANAAERKISPVLSRSQSQKRLAELKKSSGADVFTNNFGDIFKSARTKSILDELLPGDLDAGFGTGGRVSGNVNGTARDFPGWSAPNADAFFCHRSADASLLRADLVEGGKKQPGDNDDADADHPQRRRPETGP